MAPSSPSNSSNSSEASSPNVNEASSSLFLSLNAKSEPNSPESDSSPIETSITQSTTTTLENNNINTLSSVANNSATTNATHSSSNKSSPSSHDEKSASSQAITKPGNSSTVKKAVGTTNGVNSASDSSSPTVIPQQYHQSTIPTATTSATPNTTNTSTTTTSSPSSGVQPSTPNKPVLVQSKKAIHPHQPMNAYLPPQLIHHPPQLYDPNMPYQQPPVRVANANGKQTVAYGASPAVHGHLHYAYAFPPGAHPSLVQSQPPTAFYPPPPQPQHGSTVGVVHDANSLYMPVMPHPTLPNSEAESSDDESGEYSESDEEEGYTIVTMQKPSPYTEIKKKYEDLMKLYTKACKELTAAQAEISELKRKREATGSRGGFPQPSSSNSTLSPAVKKKKTESPISEPIRRTDLIPLGVDRNGNQRSAFQQLETSITSLPPPSTSVVPTSPSSDTSSSVSLNTLVYIYYYDGGCDGHGSRQLKANGKRIFIDINWDEIFKFRQDDCLHMCIFVNTSTVDKVKDSDLIATFKILRSDGDKVKISKIRENLRRLNLQNQFSHIGHIKFFIQIRGNDQLFDYTDKILLYSKTQHNIANFEPSNQKEYNELSKLFYQPERFTVFKKV